MRFSGRIRRRRGERQGEVGRGGERPERKEGKEEKQQIFLLYFISFLRLKTKDNLAKCECDNDKLNTIGLQTAVVAVLPFKTARKTVKISEDLKMKQ